PELHHREAPAPHGDRVQGTGGFLLRLQQFVASLLPLLRGYDWGLFHMVRLRGVRYEEVIGQPGPGLLGPLVEVAVGQPDAGEPGLRVHPQEAARAAEVTERPRRVPRPGPVRCLAVPDLETQ